MAIRRVTGAVSPSELIFADANALGATYDGSGTTIERGETFTLPAAGTTAVSNGALRLEALKGDCTITNNGNSTLTNASGVDGTIVMRSGASDFPAFVRNSSMGSMSTHTREDFTGAGHILQVIQSSKSNHASIASATYTDIPGTDQNDSGSVFCVKITPSSTSSKILFIANLMVGSQSGNASGKIKLKRDGIDIAKGDANSSNSTSTFGFYGSQNLDQRNMAMTILDSPSSTLEITYKPQFRSESGSYTTYINRPYQLTNAASNGYVTFSNLVVMEVAG